MISRRTTLLAPALAALSPAHPVLAQDQARPIRWVVPYPPGGATDAMARFTARGLERALPAAIVVENRSGAAGSIGSDFVRQAAPDGATLLFNASIFVLARLVLRAAPYDPLRDFQPVARVGEAPLLILAHPSVPGNTLPEVAAAVRRDPASFNIALSSQGSAGHLASLEFSRLVGTPVTTVNYRGAGPAIADLLGGSVQLMVDAGLGQMQQVRAGRLKALAITAATRLPGAPEVPTAAEAGMPSLSISSWYGIWAPRGLSEAALRRLAGAVAEAVASQDFRDAVAGIGALPVFEGPEPFARFIAADVARATALLEGAGFQPE